MGNEVTPDAMRGLLIPDTRVGHATIDAGLSAYTQASPQPGIAVPAKASGITITTSGTQRDGQTVELQTVGAAGCAAPSRSTPYSFAWRNSGGIWQGWDGPSVMSGFTPLHTWNVGVVDYRDSDTAITSIGTVLTVSTYTTGASAQIRVIRKTLSGSPSVTTLLSTFSTSPSELARACLCRLPGTAVLLFVIVKDAATTEWALRVYRSDDDGATWSLQADNAISANGQPAPSVLMRRIRAKYYAGQVLLMVALRNTTATCRDQLWQYASSTDGYSFSLRDASPGTSLTDRYNGGAHDIAVIPGRGFVLVYATSAFTLAGANSGIYSIVLPSAYMPFTGQDSEGLTNTAPSNALTANGELSEHTSIAVSADDDGTVYLFCSDYGTTPEQLRYTTDGRTWYSISYVDIGVRDSSPLELSGFQPTATSAAWYAGAFYIVTSVYNTVYTGNLGLVSLSGYAGATLPIQTRSNTPRLTSVGGVLHYVPYDLPLTFGWATTLTGAATATLNNDGYLTVTNVFDTAEFSATLANAAESTIIACAEYNASGGTGTIVVLNDTGTNRYQASVRVTNTQIIIRDVNAGVDVVTYNRTGSGYVALRVFVTDNNIDVWATETTTGAHNIVRDYTRIGSYGTLASVATVALEQRVTIRTVGTINYRSWWWNAYENCTTTHNIATPSGLAGRAMAAYPVEVSQGLGLTASGGPVVTGLSWNIPPRYAHGIEQLDPMRSPSPATVWRSQNTNQQQIVWTVSPNTTPLMGSLGALYIGGANFRTATLEGRDAGGAWVTIGTWDASVGQTGLRYNRNGQVVQPITATPGTVGAYWYPYGVLDGARVLLAGAGPMRVIERQSEGAWTHQATKHARLQLAGDMTGVPTTGTLSVVPRASVLLWNTDTMFRAYRLTIPSQPVAETYYEAGVVMIGHVAVFGRRYSWGRALTLDPNTTLTTGNSGRRTAYVEGPARRAVEFGWTDGTDQTQLTSDMSGSQPDYFRASASGTPEPVAAAVDGPYLMRGIIDQLDGPAVPVVYLPFLTRSPSGTTQMVTHPDLSLYGRVVSSSSVETVQGTEWGNKAAEVVRTSQIRIEQEV